MFRDYLPFCNSRTTKCLPCNLSIKNLYKPNLIFIGKKYNPETIVIDKLLERFDFLF
jgi:hypothetical protein